MKKILLLILIVLVLGGGFYFVKSSQGQEDISQTSQTAETKSQISANGSVASQNQATMYFQVGGQVTDLPFKVGDNVKKGDLIAAIDATDAEHTETAAEANYKSAQAALNLVLDNIHLFQYGNGGFGNVGSTSETQTQTTQRQQAEQGVNAAYDNMQIAKQNLSLYSLISPLDGIITQQSVTSIGVNIAAATAATTTFTVADPSQAVFQALVSPSDLGLISQGSQASVVLDNSNKQSSGSATLNGQVVKIYPDKTTTSTGDSAYKVDISIPNILIFSRFGQTGTVLINTANSAPITEVPTWTLLGSQYLWVMEGDTPKLKQVSVGDSRGGMTEIIKGLSSDDKVITDPKSLIKKEYKIL